MKKLVILLSITLVTQVSAQRGIATSENGLKTTLDASSIVDAEATTKGMLIPRITLSATNVAAPVVTPANSLLIYNIATGGTGATAVKPGYYYWDTPSTQWIRLMAKSDSLLPIDSAEWIDGSRVGLPAGNIYARKALLNGDTIVIKGTTFPSGSLGLGVANPSSQLHVKGSGVFENTSGAHLTIRNIANTSNATFQANNRTLELVGGGRYFINRITSDNLAINGGGGSVSIGLNAGLFPARLSVYGKTADASTYSFMAKDSNTLPGLEVDLFKVRNDGFVGVGRYTPQAKFHVMNDADASYDSAFVVKQSGFVGIGTIAPTTQLSLYSNNSSYNNGNGTARLSTFFNPAFQADLILHTASRAVGAYPFTVDSTVATIQSSGTSARHLAFANGNNESMRITSIGNVGIGTASPVAKVDIQSTDISLAAGYGRVLKLQSSHPTIEFHGVSGNKSGFIGYDSQTTPDSEGMKFFVGQTPGVIVNSPILTLKSNQDVGVGISNPLAKLHVYSSFAGAVADTNIFSRNDVQSSLGITHFLASGSSTLAASNNYGFRADFTETVVGTKYGVYIAGETQNYFSNRVGIGTTTPYAKLHIKDSIDGVFNGLAIDNRKVYGVGTGTNETSRLNLSLTETLSPDPLNRVMGYVEAGTENENSSGDGFMAFGTRTTGASVEKMRILGNGNVGVGTTTPGDKLSVNGRGEFVTTNLDHGLRIKADAGNNSSILQYTDNPVTIEWANISANATGGGQLLFSTNLAPKMAILGNGDVGIGTLAPTQKLDVIGNIRASGNFISGATTLTVPDYVFEKYYTGESKLKTEYTFKSLAEIEAFTKLNGHLPGIVSAKEIKETGNYNLTQSTLNNLEKIEELYLHVIELNKQKELLEKTVEKQQKEIKDLKVENTATSSSVEQLRAQNEKINTNYNQLKTELEQIKMLLNKGDLGTK